MKSFENLIQLRPIDDPITRSLRLLVSSQNPVGSDTPSRTNAQSANIVSELSDSLPFARLCLAVNRILWILVTSPEIEGFWCANESFAFVNAVNGGILSLQKDSRTVYT